VQQARQSRPADFSAWVRLGAPGRPEITIAEALYSGDEQVIRPDLESLSTALTEVRECI
jgi:hypothetical protein